MRTRNVETMHRYWSHNVLPIIPAEEQNTGDLEQLGKLDVLDPSGDTPGQRLTNRRELL
jgi:hypothetical protein